MVPHGSVFVRSLYEGEAVEVCASWEAAAREHVALTDVRNRSEV